MIFSAWTDRRKARCLEKDSGGMETLSSGCKKAANPFLERLPLLRCAASVCADADRAAVCPKLAVYPSEGRRLRAQQLRCVCRTNISSSVPGQTPSRDKPSPQQISSRPRCRVDLDLQGQLRFLPRRHR